MKSPSIPINPRVQNIPASATKLMPMLAARRGGCVSLGQGVPSFATPRHVVDAVCAALKGDATFSKYSLQPGLPQLRAAVAEHILAPRSILADPETEVTVTVGAMEGLLMALLTLVDTGDEVLLPSPCYPSHVEQVLLAGGVPVHVPQDPADWSLDVDAVARRVTPRTRVLLLCNPSNPTGMVLDDGTVQALAGLAAAHDLTVVADQTYDDLVYDGPRPVSPGSLPELRGRCVTVGSFSKTYALTGWRVGFVHATAHLMQEMLKVHDCTAICAPTPSQAAALAALSGPQDIFEGMRLTLSQRRDLACSRLDDLSGAFTYVRPKGAFYIMARYGFTKEPSMDLAVRLIEQAGVITVPGGSFGPTGEGHLRLSFGGDERELNEAFDRIAAWFERQ